MPQNTFTSGINWATGDVVDAESLKNTIEDATPQKALVTELTETTSVAPESDEVMIYSQTNDALRKTKIEKILTSGSDSTVGVLTVREYITSDASNTAENGIIQPNVEVSTWGTNVAAAVNGVYSCVSGQVTISTTQSINTKWGDIIQVWIAGGDASITGEFINLGTGGDISYRARNLDVADSSGSCSVVVVQSFKVTVGADGAPNDVACSSLGNTFVRGALQVNEDSQINGDLVVEGQTNHKGEVQYNGNAVFGLYDYVEQSIPFLQLNAESAGNIAVYCNQWKDVASITDITKTNKEFWDIECDFTTIHLSKGNPIAGGIRFRLILNSTNDVLGMQSHGVSYSPVQSITHYERNQIKIRVMIPANTVFSSDSIKLQAYYAWTATFASGAILNIGYESGQAPDPTVTNKIKLLKYIKP